MAVNQTLPCASTTRPCGPEAGVFRGNSLNFRVTGSSLPSLFAACAVYQSAPSGATAGSCGRDLGVGRSNSLMITRLEAAIRTSADKQNAAGMRMDFRNRTQTLLAPDLDVLTVGGGSPSIDTGSLKGVCNWEARNWWLSKVSGRRAQRSSCLRGLQKAHRNDNVALLAWK